MKKHFLFLAMPLVAALSFASCDKDEKEESSNGDENQISLNQEYVDLGLPSGTLWATCNVGATKPEEYGDYFAWGETETKSEFDMDNYKWGSSDSFTKYNTSDNYKNLLPEDDAATVNWGSDWRMPTKEEVDELCSYLDPSWTVVNGINGVKFSASNGNSIFLPTKSDRNCYYWSSSLYNESEGCGIEAELTVGKVSAEWDAFYRSSGLPIRPVRAKN